MENFEKNEEMKRIFDSMDLLELIRTNPNLSEFYNFDKLDNDTWCDLLCEHPQFADKCPFEFDGESWWYLLSNQPQFADKCPFEFDGDQWSHLLIRQPQFIEKMTAEDFKKLSLSDWLFLLDYQPQFVDYWESVDSKGSVRVQLSDLMNLHHKHNEKIKNSHETIKVLQRMSKLCFHTAE